jgi:ABC-type nitrate/sulfonate/bicarbonate transport system permease component
LGPLHRVYNPIVVLAYAPLIYLSFPWTMQPLIFLKLAIATIVLLFIVILLSTAKSRSTFQTIYKEVGKVPAI